MGDVDVEAAHSPPCEFNNNNDNSNNNDNVDSEVDSEAESESKFSEFVPSDAEDPRLGLAKSPLSAEIEQCQKTMREMELRIRELDELNARQQVALPPTEKRWVLLEWKRPVNLFELVDASKILSDHVLVGKSLLSFSFAALLGLNHFVSFLSTMTEVGEVSRV